MTNFPKTDSRTVNPYSTAAAIMTNGLNAIAALPATAGYDEFIQSIFDYVKSAFFSTYPKGSIDVELKSLIVSTVNAYANGNFEYGTELHIGNIPINAFDKWIDNLEDQAGHTGASADNQTALLLSLAFGRSAHKYWSSAVTTHGDWANFFEDDAFKNYVNINIWTLACMQGAYIGATLSPKGLISPTTNITTVNIVSALVGALAVGGAKVIFKTMPYNESLDLASLTIDHDTVVSLNERQMDEIVDTMIGAAMGPRRSRRLEGDCRYSRNHYTQCGEGERHSRSGRCCAQY